MKPPARARAAPTKARSASSPSTHRRGRRPRSFGLFNLAPPPGAPAQLGFSPYGVAIVLTPHVRQAGGEYDLALRAGGVSQRFDLNALEITLWGSPWSSAHDGQRGNCLTRPNPTPPSPPARFTPNRTTPKRPTSPCPPPAPARSPSPRSPTAGNNPAPTSPTANPTSPTSPGRPLPRPPPKASTAANCSPSTPRPAPCPPTNGPPRPVACASTSKSTRAACSARRPRPVSDQKGRRLAARRDDIDPSFGAGLGYCTPASYAAETVSSPPGAGCPNDSKIGDFSLETPLLKASYSGAIFLAQPTKTPSAPCSPST